jgi:hypothetical protein
MSAWRSSGRPTLANWRYQVRLLGLDVFDPATMQPGHLKHSFSSIIAKILADWLEEQQK